MKANKKVLAKKIKKCEELAAAEKLVAATKSVKKGKAVANSDDDEGKEEEAEGVFSLFRS
jgi:hypothetical protein